MDSQLIHQQSPKLISYLSWIMIAFSIYSCSARADYNIIIGFLILLLRSQSASEKYKLFIKAAIHILLISVLVDIIWIFEYTGYWRHGEETSDLWKSLSLIHNTTYFVGILECLLKIPILFFLYKTFNSLGGQRNELLNLKYSPK